MTQAPGDVDVFCTLPSVSVIPHVHPANISVLMDSNNYINLLPPVGIPGSRSVWQGVGEYQLRKQVSYNGNIYLLTPVMYLASVVPDVSYTVSPFIIIL